jgi:hypothetical protein
MCPRTGLDPVESRKILYYQEPNLIVLVGKINKTVNEEGVNIRP